MTLQALALVLSVAALMAPRAPAGWSLCLQKQEKGNRQACILWVERETLAAALRRLAWLALAKWLALRRAPLQVTALGVEPAGKAVLLRVAVSWGMAAVPLLNAAGPHHITLCRCEDAAVAQRLQARAAPWLWEKGETRQPLAERRASAERPGGWKACAASSRPCEKGYWWRLWLSSLTPGGCTFHCERSKL